MTSIWDIISALGTIVAALSVICAFILYRIQKRDEYLTKIRESLQTLSYNISELNSILNFELAYEMAYSLVYTEPVQYTIEGLLRICNDAINDKNHNKDNVIKNIESTLMIFGTSFTGAIITKYSDLISETKQASTIFNPNYKGLFRFSKSSVTLMRRILINYKNLILDEELLSELIYNHMIDGSNEWKCTAQFKKELLDHLISIMEISRKNHHQNDVNNLIALVDLVYSRHIELSTKEWNELAKASKKVNLTPYEQTKTVIDDFREAGKCFNSIFSHDDIVQYSSLVQKIEDANTKD